MSDAEFSDFDPEDAYDVDDPPHVRLRVLELVVEDLLTGARDGRRQARAVDALRVLTVLECDFDVLRDRLEAIRRALEGVA